MPVPSGKISGTNIWKGEQPIPVEEPEVEEAQDIADFDIVLEMDEEKIPWEEVKKDLEIEDDLPELS